MVKYAVISLYTVKLGLSTEHMETTETDRKIDKHQSLDNEKHTRFNL